MNKLNFQFFSKFKLKKFKNINIVQKASMDNSLNQLSYLLNFDVKKKYYSNHNQELTKSNFFNPQTKENLKENLIRFLAYNKPVKQIGNLKPETPKKEKIFFKNYQSELFNKRLSKFKHYNQIYKSAEFILNNSNKKEKYFTKLNLPSININKSGSYINLKDCISKIVI